VASAGTFVLHPVNYVRVGEEEVVVYSCDRSLGAWVLVHGSRRSRLNVDPVEWS
jgi:hypothetical protein